MAFSLNEGSPKSFLLGSMDNMCLLEEEDRKGISNTLNVPVHNVLEFAFASKKCLLADKGFEGTICVSGESVIILIPQGEVVMKVDKFLSIKDNTESYQRLVKGNLYEYVFTENGQPVKQFWSGFIDVKSNPQTEAVFLHTDSIQRKVFLYADSKVSSTATVVEFQRCLSELPFDIVVPVFPEKGDMVLVQGAEVSDIWYGLVQNVDYTRRTVDIYFYIESPRMPNIFVRESFGRGSKNTVSWNALLAVADGQWLNPSKWQKGLQ